MKPSTFAERLAYARWVYHGARGEVLSNTDIAEAVERTQPWVTKWAVSESPPRDYEVHEPLAKVLGVDERWLIRGEGDPPRPDLWKGWIEETRKRQTAGQGARGQPAGRPSAAAPKKDRDRA